MIAGQPSRTAIVAAGYRAAHQTCEGGRIFSDPHALAILGTDGNAIVSALSAAEPHGPMRIFMAARSRFAEDHIAAAVARGVRQLVILGAGLDTFSIRMRARASESMKSTARHRRHGNGRASPRLD